MSKYIGVVIIVISLINTYSCTSQTNPTEDVPKLSLDDKIFNLATFDADAKELLDAELIDESMHYYLNYFVHFQMERSKFLKQGYERNDKSYAYAINDMTEFNAQRGIEIVHQVQNEHYNLNIDICEERTDSFCYTLDIQYLQTPAPSEISIDLLVTEFPAGSRGLHISTAYTDNLPENNECICWGLDTFLDSEVGMEDLQKQTKFIMENIPESFFIQQLNVTNPSVKLTYPGKEPIQFKHTSSN